MKKANIVFGILFIIFSVSVIVFTLINFPAGVNNVPGPAMFPVIIASIMILASLFIIFHYLRLKEDVVINWLSNDKLRAYIAMAIIIIYVFIVPIVGFYVMSFVLLMILIRWFRKKSFVYTAIVSIAILGLVFVVFNIALRVPLNFGILF